MVEAPREGEAMRRTTWYALMTVALAGWTIAGAIA
jgi:hypothetical protein